MPCRHVIRRALFTLFKLIAGFALVCPVIFGSWSVQAELTAGGQHRNTRSSGDCLDCNRTLRKLHESLQAWRRRHNGEYPERLTQLVHAELTPQDGPICPAVRMEMQGADAKHHLTTSRREGGDPTAYYEYELSPIPKWENEEPWLPHGSPHYTRRDIKLELLRRPHSDQIPLVRCSSHRMEAPVDFRTSEAPMRNLTTTGNIYWSDSYWELLWVKDVPYVARESIVLFGLKGPPFYVDSAPSLNVALDLRPWTCAFGDHPWWWTLPLFDYPPNRHTTPDLKPFFQERHGRVLREGDSEWWVNGLVQLQGRTTTEYGKLFQESRMQSFVWERTGLPVDKRFRRAAWLQGTAWRAPIGVPVGWLIWHYQDGSTERVPITYGQNTARFWSDPSREKEESSFPAPIWKYSQTAEEVGRDRWLRLYEQSWTNPHPDKLVSSLNFISNRESPAAPFIVAINTYP